MGRYVLLPGDPFRTGYIASFLDDARLVAHNREHRTWKKCKNVCSLLMPLFFSTVRRSTDLAMAMEARCYGGNIKRTRMNGMKLEKRDFAASVIFLLFIAVIVAQRIIM